MISFLCARCGFPFRIDDDRAGERLRCDACGQFIEVPSAERLPAPPLPRAVPRVRDREEPPPERLSPYEGRGVALASVVVGALGVVSFCVPIIGGFIALTALALGVAARVGSRDRGALAGMSGGTAGLAMTGIILVVVGLVLNVMPFVLTALAPR